MKEDLKRLQGLHQELNVLMADIEDKLNETYRLKREINRIRSKTKKSSLTSSSNTNKMGCRVRKVGAIDVVRAIITK